MPRHGGLSQSPTIYSEFHRTAPIPGFPPPDSPRRRWSTGRLTSVPVLYHKERDRGRDNGTWRIWSWISVRDPHTGRPMPILLNLFSQYSQVFPGHQTRNGRCPSILLPGFLWPRCRKIAAFPRPSFHQRQLTSCLYKIRAAASSSLSPSPLPW